MHLTVADVRRCSVWRRLFVAAITPSVADYVGPRYGYGLQFVNHCREAARIVLGGFIYEQQQ